MIRAFLFGQLPVFLELCEVGGDSVHISLQEFIDIPHLGANHLEFGVSHVEPSTFKLTQMLYFFNPLPPVCFSVLQLPVQLQHIRYLFLLFFRYPVGSF